MTHKESLEQSQNYSHNINCKFSLLLGEAITSNNIDITNIYIYIYIIYIYIYIYILFADVTKYQLNDDTFKI